jgi:precorrin-3B synthase
MNAPHRRLACPGLAEPMETGDGYLARLVPSGETIDFDAFQKLCAAARAHGNGIIEITPRGSIQVRGLRSSSISAFGTAVRALDIATDGVPITIDPLAGLDPNEANDAGTLAGALRIAQAQAPFAARLGPKVSVVIDGGTTLHLDLLDADIRLRPDGQRVHVMLGRDAFQAAYLGAVARSQVTAITLRILKIVAQRGREARARDLIRADGLAAFRSALGPLAIDASLPPPRPPSVTIGMHRLRGDHVALGIGVAFGHTDADTLDALIDAAKTAGARGLRAAPERTLLVIGVAAEAASSLTTTAERLGFVTRVDDPRRHIATCAGAPICAAGQIPARALAPMIATAAADLLDGSFVLHLSGCGKGCAYHADSPLTIVGAGGGCDVVLNGGARGLADVSIATDSLPWHLIRLSREVARGRDPGERAADVLARLGAARICAILSETAHG